MYYHTVFCFIFFAMFFAEDFLAHGGSEPAIYSINQGELDLYVTGADVMSL